MSSPARKCRAPATGARLPASSLRVSDDFALAGGQLERGRVVALPLLRPDPFDRILIAQRRHTLAVYGVPTVNPATDPPWAGS